MDVLKPDDMYIISPACFKIPEQKTMPSDSEVLTLIQSPAHPNANQPSVC